MGSRCSLRKRVINTATSIGTAALSSLLLLGAAGCDKKSGPTEGQQPATNAPAQAAAVSSRAEASLRIHWIGKQHIEADTNAAYLTSIWKAPESQKLEAEVLDKLSVAPWRVNSTNLEESLLAHPASRLFRPLLGDLLNDEFYLELTPRTNGPAEASLALRIAGAQAGVWKANLLAALEELGGREDGAPPAGIDWRVAMTNPSLRDVTFQLAHAGDWTIVSAGPEENTLFMEMLHRAQTEGAPWSRINSWRITGANGNPVPAAKPEPTDPWLQLRADLADFPIFSNALPLLAGNIPRIEISVTGDGKNVRSHA
ncbi:MAG TPA: hypothetical protein VHH88_12655, partial [Verrucomicrobiae bacterium]|nr:hypothetical protein [Verrucomicrobiae bacterium]